MIAAGRLDRRATFQRLVVTQDALGEDVPGGAEIIARVAARRMPLRDQELVAAAQVGRSVTDRFLTRWTATLAALDLTEQLICDGTVYDLVSRSEMGRREGLEWSATARPALVAA